MSFEFGMRWASLSRLGIQGLAMEIPTPPSKIQSGNRGRRSVARDGARRRHPDFSALEARVRETQGVLRRV
jgi:hypothetical protein